MTGAAMDLSDDAFESLVNADVRSGSSPSGALLREPENCYRWRRALMRLKRKVEAQFASHRADKIIRQAECMARGPGGLIEWKQFEGQEEKWRSQAIRFLHGLEEALVEANDCVNRVSSDVRESEERNEIKALAAEVERLRKAIRSHRKATYCHREPDAADVALWSYLD